VVKCFIAKVPESKNRCIERPKLWIDGREDRNGGEIQSAFWESVGYGTKAKSG
jgi:hypothetical protein